MPEEPLCECGHRSHGGHDWGSGYCFSHDGCVEFRPVITREYVMAEAIEAWNSFKEGKIAPAAYGWWKETESGFLAGFLAARGFEL